MPRLKPTSPEEYIKLTTKLVKVPSGAVFKIKTLPGAPIVRLLEILPEKGIEDRMELYKFVKEHFEELVRDVIIPGIVEPKIDPEVLSFMDAVMLFGELLKLSGLGAEEVESRESFRGRSTRR